MTKHYSGTIDRHGHVELTEQPDYTPAILWTVGLICLAVIFFPYGVYLLLRWQARTLSRMWNDSDRTTFWLSSVGFWFLTGPLVLLSFPFSEWNVAPGARRALAIPTVGILAVGLVALAFE